MGEFNRVQGLPNNEKDEEIIVQKFMAELCKRDDEHNRGVNVDSTSTRNVFPVEQIRLAVLEGYELNFVLRALRGQKKVVAWRLLLPGFFKSCCQMTAARALNFSYGRPIKIC